MWSPVAVNLIYFGSGLFIGFGLGVIAIICLSRSVTRQLQGLNALEGRTEH